LLTLSAPRLLNQRADASQLSLLLTPARCVFCVQISILASGCDDDPS
jgi:hypothetical protein